MVAQPLLDRLQREWTQLFAPFGADPREVASTWDDLRSAYAGPGRYYHTLEHIGHVLETITRLCALACDLPAIQLAAFFHDVVYDSKAPDNEERSADWAREVLPRLRVPVEITDRVAALILLTKTHQAAAEDRDAHILLDADLAILGAEELDYDAYAQAIRQEYGWVPEAAYRSSRREVLQRFLKRDRIYRTEPMFGAYEERARRNLGREIAALSAWGNSGKPT